MWFRRRKETDYRAEIEAHLSHEADRLIAEGMPPAQAQAAARRTFGNVAMAQEAFHESQHWLWWSHLGRDLRYGLRMLAKSPAFTVAAALTIALGVGANTAVFRLVDAVLLQSLAVQRPQELVFIDSVGTAPPSAAPYPCLTRLPAATGLFTGLAIFATDEMRAEIDGRAEPIFGQVSSGNYFELLGTKPALGRLMQGGDERPDPPVAVISSQYWQRRFNRDDGVLGKSITIGDRLYTVAGVTPPEFLGLEPGRPVDVTIPIETAGGIQTYAGPWWFDVIARLKPGVSGRQAQAAANAAFQACMTDSGSRAERAGTRPQRLGVHSAAHGSNTLRGRFSRPLFALMGIVILVLLLATVNVANLLLARGIGRSREFAIRLATGASRVQLIRQVLTETLLLFGLSAVPGIVLAGWGASAVTALFAQGRRPITLETSLNWRILAFSVGATLAAGLLSGLFPVWRVFRANTQAMKEGQTRTSESRASAALMHGLVGFQVAVSLILLTGAITFARTLSNLRHVDLGFKTGDVLTMSIELHPSLKSSESVGAWSRALAAIREVPGLSNAALSVLTPLSGRDSGATPVRIRGYHPVNVDDSTVRVNHVSEGYFETLGIDLLRGRLLSDRDREGALNVVVINESTARQFFGEQDPLGQGLEFQRKGAANVVYQIVGVIRDTRHNDLREPSPRFAFVSIRQPVDTYRRLTLTVASAAPGGQAALLESIRSRLARVHRGLLISEVITIQRQLDSTLLTERLLSGLSAAFGVLALVLASVGLFGVLSYRVGQQRQSIGIRMVLGASPLWVAFGVLRQSACVLAAGLLCGLPLAFLAARTADSLFWGVTSSDSTTYLIGAAILCVVGLVSAWVPARRASGVEPAEALRHN